MKYTDMPCCDTARRRNFYINIPNGFTRYIHSTDGVNSKVMDDNGRIIKLGPWAQVARCFVEKQR